jgi:hypothetical protein
VLAVGLALVWLGLPRLLGATARQPARAVLWALRDGKPLTDADLARGEAALERSRRWSGTPAYALSDLALLKLLRLEQGEEDGRAARYLAGALEAQEAGLAQAPAGGNGWARLAYARYRRSGLSEATRDALELSLLSGGLDLTLLSFRLELILHEWDALGPEFHEAARGEIHQMTRHGRPGYDALVEIYLASPRAGVIDAALADSPAQQAQFSRRLEHRIGSP